MIDIVQLFGKDVDNFLQYCCMIIFFDQFYFFGYDYVDCVMIDNNCLFVVLCNMQMLYNIGCLVGIGYFFILLVDQGVEYFVGVLFVVNLFYFDLKNIVELVIEVGCNCVVLIYGVLVLVLWCYVYCILFFVKFNYNEMLSYLNIYD